MIYVDNKWFCNALHCIPSSLSESILHNHFLCANFLWWKLDVNGVIHEFFEILIIYVFFLLNSSSYMGKWREFSSINAQRSEKQKSGSLHTRKVKRLQPERMANKQKQAHTRYNAMIDQKVDTVLQDSIIDIVKWVILQDCTILTSSMYIARRRILTCLNISTRSFILNVGFARFVLMKTWSFPFHT